jgi:Zn ribbon nucleic-acid-binding protein
VVFLTRFRFCARGTVQECRAKGRILLYHLSSLELVECDTSLHMSCVQMQGSELHVCFP